MGTANEADFKPQMVQLEYLCDYIMRKSNMLFTFLIESPGRNNLQGEIPINNTLMKKLTCSPKGNKMNCFLYSEYYSAKATEYCL